MQYRAIIYRNKLLYFTLTRQQETIKEPFLINTSFLSLLFSVSSVVDIILFVGVEQVYASITFTYVLDSYTKDNGLLVY
jgi:hypothetical protein